jgi:hypothetical protein
MTYRESLKAADLILERAQSGSAALRTDSIARALRDMRDADVEGALRMLLVQWPYIKQDALRYRWIAYGSSCPFAETDDAWDSKENLDAAVDERIAQEAKCSAS